MQNGKFVGGSAMARMKAKKNNHQVVKQKIKSVHKHSQKLKKNQEKDREIQSSSIRVILCRPPERFFASMFHDHSVEDIISSNKDDNWHSVTSTITARANLEFPSSLISTSDCNSKIFYYKRASLVLEESRHVLCEELQKKKLYDSWIHVRLLSCTIRKHRFDFKLCKIIENDMFTAQEQFDLKPGYVVLLRCTTYDGIQKDLLACIFPSVYDLYSVTLSVFKTDGIEVNLNAYSFSIKPITSLISQQRQFVACLEKPAVPFLFQLMGVKRSIHTRFDDDENVDSNLHILKDQKEVVSTYHDNDCKEAYLSLVEISKNNIICPHLNQSQEKAAKSFLDGPLHNISLVQGPPGTGKTTFMTAVLIRTFFKGIEFPQNSTCLFDSSKRCLVTAPTNKAVSVIAKRFLAAIHGFHDINCVLIGVEDALFSRDRDDEIEDGDMVALRNSFLYTFVEKLSEDSQFLFTIDTSNMANVTHALKFLSALTRKLTRCIPKTANKYDVLKNAKSLYDALSGIECSNQSYFDRDHVMTLFTSFKHLENSGEFQFELLMTANIIFSTLTSSSVSLMRNIPEIDELYVDEAAAATETEVFIPLHLNPKRMLAVGDPKQLPAFVSSQRAIDLGFDKSLLDRLMCTCNEGHMMLDTQYRMNPAISTFPSNQFYGGRLIDGENVSASSYCSDVQLLNGKPYTFIDVNGCEQRTNFGSYYNNAEAKVVLALVQQLRKKSLSVVQTDWSSQEKIRIITFYSGQAKHINHQLKKIGLNGVFCATVDSCQGCESDIIIISFVRNGDNTGFLNDDRRLNVAITRAKHQLICVGNYKTLYMSGGSLKRFVQDAKERGFIKKIGSI